MARNKRKKNPRVVPTVGTARERRTIDYAKRVIGTSPIIEKRPNVGMSTVLLPRLAQGMRNLRGRRGA